MNPKGRRANARNVFESFTVANLPYWPCVHDLLYCLPGFYSPFFKPKTRAMRCSQNALPHCLTASQPTFLGGKKWYFNLERMKDFLVLPRSRSSYRSNRLFLYEHPHCFTIIWDHTWKLRFKENTVPIADHSPCNFVSAAILKLGFLGKRGYDIFGKNKMFAPRIKWQSLRDSAEDIKKAATSYEQAYNSIKTMLETNANFAQVCR